MRNLIIKQRKKEDLHTKNFPYPHATIFAEFVVCQNELFQGNVHLKEDLKHQAKSIFQHKQQQQQQQKHDDLNLLLVHCRSLLHLGRKNRLQKGQV